MSNFVLRCVIFLSLSFFFLEGWGSGGGLIGWLIGRLVR